MSSQKSHCTYFLNIQYIRVCALMLFTFYTQIALQCGTVAMHCTPLLETWAQVSMDTQRINSVTQKQYLYVKVLPKNSKTLESKSLEDVMLLLHFCVDDQIHGKVEHTHALL